MHQRQTLRSRTLRSKQLRSHTIGGQEPAVHTRVTTTQTSNGVSSRGGIVSQRSVKEFSAPVYEVPIRNGIAQFYPDSVSNNQTGGLDVFLVPGYVWCDDPLSAASDPAENGWFYTMPEYNGTPLDEKGEDRPKFSVDIGQSIYAKVERDETGVVQTPVELVILDSEEVPGHYQPVDPEQVAQRGEYEYIEILKVELEDERLVIVQLHSGPIKFAVTLVGGKNVGGYKEVYQRYERNEGVHKFRSLQRGWGSKLSQNTDSIKFEFDGVNVGTGNEVLIPEGTEVEGAQLDQAAFRTMKEGPSGRNELTIEQTVDSLRFMGNGNTGALTFLDETAAILHEHTWKDGFVTSGSATLRFRKFVGVTEPVTSSVSLRAPVPMTQF